MKAYSNTKLLTRFLVCLPQVTKNNFLTKLITTRITLNEWV